MLNHFHPFTCLVFLASWFCAMTTASVRTVFPSTSGQLAKGPTVVVADEGHEES